MTNNNKVLSIIAYYLSEYDMVAVRALGYITLTEAFKKISVALKHDNNYLKLRRDEFDALPTSSNHRKGWANRPPIKDVVILAEYLKTYSFEELTEIVKGLIDNHEYPYMQKDYHEKTAKDENMSEDDLESIINKTDLSATIKTRLAQTKYRAYNITIIQNLKLLYKGHCQICGYVPCNDLGIDICEAHHIDYFSTSLNNNASNIIILCPNHHRLIHKLHPVFDRGLLLFKYQNNYVEPVRLNIHLG